MVGHPSTILTDKNTLLATHLENKAVVVYYNFSPRWSPPHEPRHQSGQPRPVSAVHSVRWSHGRAARRLLRCWQHSSLPQPDEDAGTHFNRSSSFPRAMADSGAQNETGV